MDPFSKLPAEINFQILVSLSSFDDALKLSSASSVMLQQLRAYRLPIHQRYIERDYGDLIQDAMAIILFPRTITPDNRSRLVDAHLQKWGSKAFRLGRGDVTVIRQLDALYKRTWRYIEDYLTKARSPFLPRAYLRLPRWAHAHFSRSFTQIRLARGASHFSRQQLTDAEQRRILQAFLRYELLCKVYGPLHGQLVSAFRRYQNQYGFDTRDAYDGYPKLDDPLSHWDWCLLFKYEGKAIDLDDPPRELLLLPCVREYVLTLYGALIADQLRVCPPRPDADPSSGNSAFINAPSRGWCGFPEYDPDADWEDLHRSGGSGWSKPVVSLLASTGFDVLTQVLTSSGISFRQFMYQIAKEVNHSPPAKEATNVYVPPSGPSRRQRLRWHCNDFIRLHRQRAWVLFDRQNSFSSAMFPTVEQYTELYGDGPPGSVVGWGLEEDDSRNEWICFGGSYPALKERLKPFWEVRTDVP